MRDVLVLGYHAVSDTWPATISVAPDQLERQLEFLVEHGYRGATFIDAVTAPPHRRTLAVTFDDGYRSVLAAAPILARLGLVGSLFVVTDWPDRARPMDWPNIDRYLAGPHERELMPMSWEEIGSLADAGWEIGSHTCSHPHLRAVDDTRLAHELAASRGECEARLGQPCRSVAYPFGEVDARVVAAARTAGYRAGAALTWRLRRGGALDWPRVGVSRTDPWGYWRQRVAPVKRWLVGSYAGDRLLFLDRTLRPNSP